MLNLKSGVSTACFYPMETKDSFLFLAENKIKNIEIFFNSNSELEPDYIKNLLHIKNFYDINITSVHPFTSGSEPLYFFSDYPSRFEDGIKIYANYFKAAEKLESPIFVFHGDFKNSKFEAEKGYENIRRITEFAKQFGVNVAQENVSRCKSHSPEYLRGLKEYFPEMKFVLDVKQALRSGFRPSDYINQLGSSIAHVHISDNKNEMHCLPIGWGNMNIGNFAENLLKTGFSGHFVLELYRDNFNLIEDVINSYQNLAIILNKI